MTYESAAQSLSILFGVPGGTLQVAVSRPLGFAINSLAAADLNNDGAADLVLTSAGQTAVAILLNGGDGSFAPPAFYSAGIGANYVSVADLNRDGSKDLVVAGISGFVILRGLDSGAFTAPQVLPTTIAHYWLGVADFNNDGNLDFVGDGSPGSFYAGKGDGTFAAPTSIPAIGYGAVIGDVTGDGKIDIAFIERTFNRERVSGQQVSILINLGSASFLNGINIFYTDAGSGQVATGDFNGDGRGDLAIWLDIPCRLSLITDGSSLARGVPVNLGSAYGASMVAADVDGNGSSDIVLLNKTVVTLVRNTHGNPLLLAMASVDPASVTGRAQVQGTVTLGGPAPAGGATVMLSSSDPQVAYPVIPTVSIPAGAASATFSISTAAVAAFSTATISAAYNGVVQDATLSVVAPYSVAGLTVDPVSQFGGYTVQGTVFLSGPADSNATIYLTSANSAVASVPPTVQVPAGATSVKFPVALQPVAADTPVAISASVAGVTRNGAVTVLRALDKVQLTRAQYDVRSSQLRIEATSSSESATLTVWNATTGALVGTLAPAGGGKYTGSFTLSPAVVSATVKSSLGGIATGPVTQK